MNWLVTHLRDLFIVHYAPNLSLNSIMSSRYAHMFAFLCFIIESSMSTIADANQQRRTVKLNVPKIEHLLESQSFITPHRTLNISCLVGDVCFSIFNKCLRYNISLFTVFGLFSCLHSPVVPLTREATRDHWCTRMCIL